MKHILSLIFVISSLVVFAQSDVLDLSFSGDGKLTTPINKAIAAGPVITEDHKLIYIRCTDPDSLYSQTKIQINQDGSYDETIGEAGWQSLESFELPQPYCEYGSIGRILQQTDNKLIVVGYWETDEGFTWSYFIARYNENGSLDSTFGENGTFKIFDGDNHEITAIALQADNKIIFAVSDWTYYDHFVSINRLNNDGSYDTSFSHDGVFTFETFWDENDFIITGIYPDSLNNIYCAGQRTVEDVNSMHILKFTPGGEKDISFGDDGGIIIPGTNLAWGENLRFVDGKIHFSAMFPETYEFLLAHFNTDGSFDNSFSDDGRQMVSIADIDSDNLFWSYPPHTLFDKKGNIYWAWIDSSLTQITVAKFLPDGSIDISFSHDGRTEFAFDQPLFRISDIAFDTEDKLVITSLIYNDAGEEFIATARIFIDGTLTGIEDEQMQHDFAVYPVPAKDYININIDENALGSVMQIKDADGRIVHTCQINNLHEEINTNYLPAGIYHIILYKERSISTASFIKI